MQAKIYNSYINSNLTTKTIETGNAGNALSLVTSLRKIVNHPDLLFNKPPSTGDMLEAWTNAVNLFPKDYSSADKIFHSAKMMFFERIVSLSEQVGDKVLVISNFSKTLDFIQAICDLRKFSFLRLDGSTAIKKRLELVNQFNKPLPYPSVFLLSCKAGGCGLNLIGANRLILFDPD